MQRTENASGRCPRYPPAEWFGQEWGGVSSHGAPYQLPFAPAAGTTYQPPEGNPLVFDSPQNIWYQVDPDGWYTPLYSVP